MKFLLRSLPLFSIAAAFIFSGTGPVNAAEITLQQGLNAYTGTADTSIFEDTPNNSAGGFNYLFLGKTKTGSPRRILIRFDLSGVVPPTATITSATLQFYTEFGRPEALVDATMHAITPVWSEGNNLLKDGDNVGQGSPAEVGDPTWFHSSFNTTAWAQPGGDFTPTASASGTGGLTDTYFQLSGPGMVTDLQGWLANPASNRGWLIKGENASQNAKRYYSSESSNSRKPTLFIEYTNGNSAADDWELYQ